MKFLKVLVVGLALTFPALVAADANDLPGSAEWYLHIDLDKMKSEDAGKALYGWLEDEAFSEVEEEAGIDIGKELSSLTAFSVAGAGPVIVLDGDFSQETRDKFMTVVAAEGDLNPLKASGKNYYRVGEEDKVSYSGDDVNITIDSLDDGAWMSMDVKGKLLITGSEDQMKSLLKNNGRVPGSNGNKGALLVLTAEKALLQAGMQSDMIDADDGDSWDSNILRNTEQVAFLMAAAKDKLAIEAKLITAEAEMAESLASVARGLISLVAFDDSMEPEAIAMLRGTKIEADGNTLSLSLAVDPELLVNTIN